MVSCEESLGIIFITFFVDSTGFALNLTNLLVSIMTMMAGKYFLWFLSSFVSEMGRSFRAASHLPLFVRHFAL